MGALVAFVTAIFSFTHDTWFTNLGLNTLIEDSDDRSSRWKEYKTWTSLIIGEATRLGHLWCILGAFNSQYEILGLQWCLDWESIPQAISQTVTARYSGLLPQERVISNKRKRFTEKQKDTKTNSSFMESILFSCIVMRIHVPNLFIFILLKQNMYSINIRHKPPKHLKHQKHRCGIKWPQHQANFMLSYNGNNWPPNQRDFSKVINWMKSMV